MISLPEVDYGPDMIWYAAYGSNLSKDRFLCYIKGGQPEGASEGQIGMEDKSPPLMDAPFRIPHELYFADSTDRWGGGVAFISSESSTKYETLCRIYLIKRQQFIELVAQENRVLKEEVQINFDQLAAKSRYIACSGWYGLVLKVGQHAGCPVYTFTRADAKQSKPTPPSETYLRTIIRGLVECWSQLKNDDIVSYTHNMIQGAYDKEDIESWLKYCEEGYVKKHLTSEDLFRVQPTECRKANDREFIAQLSRKTRDFLQVKPPDTLVLASVHNGCEFRVMARLNNAAEEPADHVIRIDQKLRIAIGVQIGDWIRVRKMSRAEKPRLAKIWERQIGTQPELMRVYRATFEDMEIPIARIPASIFDVIGTEPGRFVSIQSIHRIARVRATALSLEAWTQRMKLIKFEQGEHPNPRKVLCLDRLKGASIGNDIPPIFIDLDMRNELGVKLCDCVRVVRDVRDSYFSRIHIAALPLMFALIGVAMSFNINKFGKIAIITVVILLSMLTLYIEVRSKIK